MPGPDPFGLYIEEYDGGFSITCEIWAGKSPPMPFCRRLEAFFVVIFCCPEPCPDPSGGLACAVVFEAAG